MGKTHKLLLGVEIGIFIHNFSLKNSNFNPKFSNPLISNH
jgi:hypothetical protein